MPVPIRLSPTAPVRMRHRIRRISDSVLSILSLPDTKEKLHFSRTRSICAAKAFILLLLLSVSLILLNTLLHSLSFFSLTASTTRSSTQDNLLTAPKSALSVHDYPAVLVADSEAFKENTPPIGEKADSFSSIVRPASDDEVSEAPGFDAAEEPVARMIVITMDRAAALERLLTSLAAANYGEDHVNLDIWIDRRDGKAIDEGVLRKCRQFVWKYGTKTVHKHTANAGLYQQWIYTWNITAETTEFAVILEDDLQVSPAFYQWLRLARAAYAQDSDVGAFTLQRSTLRPRHVGGKYSSVLDISSQHHVFKYKLLGTWGFAPQRDVWVEFRKWFEAKRARNEKPYVDGLITTKWYKDQERDGFAPNMWSQWWIKFVDERGYFTVTPHLPDGTTLAANWRESGLHYSKRKPSRDFPVFQGNAEQLSNMPESLLQLGWDGRAVGNSEA